MSKPNYRVSLTFDPDRKVFLARAPELEHCSAEGATRPEAIANLEQEIDAQLANMLSHGTAPPRSVDEQEHSGEFTVKVSKALHRELAYQARSEAIELSQLSGELLASALESRKGQRGPRSGNARPVEHGDSVGNRSDGNRRGGFGAGRGNNSGVLDDRATFIEYVRGLESGQTGPTGGGYGHNRGGGGPGARPHHDGNNGRRRGGRGQRGGSNGGGGNGGFRNDQNSNRGPHPMQGRSPEGNGRDHGAGANPGNSQPTSSPAPAAGPSTTPPDDSGDNA